MHLPVTTCVRRGRSDFAALGLLGCVLIAAGAGGCNRGNAHTRGEQSLVPGVDLPRVDESPSQLRQQMVGLNPESAPFKELQFKVLVAWDKIRRQVGVDGYREVLPPNTTAESACVDQATGKIAFRALVCWNPNCPGRGKGGGPPVFVKQWTSATVGENGKLVWTPPARPADPLQENLTQYFIRCPYCDQSFGVAYYDPPEVVLRRRQLDEELRAARLLRRKARDSGEMPPSHQRPPSDIMKEMSEQPKLFLVPE